MYFTKILAKIIQELISQHLLIINVQIVIHKIYEKKVCAESRKHYREKNK